MFARNGLLRNFKRFLRNEAGNYAIMFGITLFPIVGAVSLAVDYSNIQRHRAAVQDALDAAALASAKEYSSGVTGAALENYADDFVAANLPSFIEPNTVDVELSLVNKATTDSNGEPSTMKTVRLDADVEYDSFIAKAIGYEEFMIGVVSQVALGNITVEVALVMDNSGSMDSKGKISSARNTAKNLVDTIFSAGANSNDPDPVSFSLVPFAGLVNVGNDNDDEDWMDTNGWSSIHHENLDWKKTYITRNAFNEKGAGFREKINNVWTWKSRYDIFDMLDVDWAGCVEMRPWPYNTTDDAASTGAASGSVVSVNENSSKSDRDKLFVPFFSPAEPYSKYAYKSSGGWGWGWGGGGSSTNHSNDWYNYPNDYLYDWMMPRTTNTTQLEQLYYTDPFGSPYNKGVIQSDQNLRQDWVWRYQAAALDDDYYFGDNDGEDFGPNYGCYMRPITKLTTSKSTIKNEIDKMKAKGSTNIQQGIAWGWRTLSPSMPFTGGRDATDEKNRKYMIVLTDGNNTYYSNSTPNGSTYGAWGYDKQGRMDEGLSSADLAGTPYAGTYMNTYEKKMNAHTLQTCNNAKAAGVTIFTIAFDVSNGSSVKEMLETCAGSGTVNNRLVMSSGTFYFDVSASQLDAAMEAIASQISELRIVR